MLWRQFHFDFCSVWGSQNSYLIYCHWKALIEITLNLNKRFRWTQTLSTSQRIQSLAGASRERTGTAITLVDALLRKLWDVMTSLVRSGWWETVQKWLFKIFVTDIVKKDLFQLRSIHLSVYRYVCVQHCNYLQKNYALNITYFYKMTDDVSFPISTKQLCNMTLQLLFYRPTRWMMHCN